MNEKLSRPQFNQMDTIEKQTLMESLAARYDMTFLGLHTFDPVSYTHLDVYKRQLPRHSQHQFDAVFLVDPGSAGVVVDGGDIGTGIQLSLIHI